MSNDAPPLAEPFSGRSADQLPFVVAQEVAARPNPIARAIASHELKLIFPMTGFFIFIILSFCGERRVRKFIASSRTAHGCARCDRGCHFTDDSMGMTGAAGHDEHRGDDGHRHQRRPHPFRLCHRDDCADDRVFDFHNCVFPLLVLFFCSCERQVRKIHFRLRLPDLCVGCHPQQQPDFPSGLAPAGVDKNFCRQWSLQK